MIRARRRVLLSLVALAALVALAPRPAAAADAAPTPVRVATFCPFVNEALAGAGDRAQVVATVRRSFHQPVPEGVADLGTPHTPNVEVLASSGATLVVIDRTSHAALAPKLSAQGLEVFEIDTSSVEATFTGLTELGKRTGASDVVDPRIEKARSALAAQKPAEPTRVLALMGTPSSFFVMTKRSWQGDLLAKLGFVNVAADVVGEERAPGFVPLSDEVLVGLAPDRVLLVAHGDVDAVKQAFERRMQERGVWRSPKDGAFPVVEVLPPERFLANPGLALPEVARLVVSDAPQADVAAPPRGAAASEVVPSGGATVREVAPPSGGGL